MPLEVILVLLLLAAGVAGVATGCARGRSRVRRKNQLKLATLKKALYDKMYMLNVGDSITHDSQQFVVSGPLTYCSDRDDRWLEVPIGSTDEGHRRWLTINVGSDRGLVLWESRSSTMRPGNRSLCFDEVDFQWHDDSDGLYRTAGTRTYRSVLSSYYRSRDCQRGLWLVFKRVAGDYNVGIGRVLAIEKVRVNAADV